MTGDLYWQRLDQLVQGSEIIIDRPRGTAHPRYPDFIYPHDYGYLKDTVAVDGGGIDVWVGSLPHRQVTGVICTVDLTKHDAEIKILIGCAPDEAQTILRTHNEGPQSAILIPRE